jgi:PAS domain S-box-containing protein
MKEFYNAYTGLSVSREESKDIEIDYNGQTLIAEIDLKGMITYTNRNLREMLAYTKEEILGLPFKISLHPDMPEGICSEAFELAKEGKIWSGYIKSMTRNGEYFWTSVFVQPKYDTEENMVGYVIRKQPADQAILDEVKEEFSRLGSLKPGEYKSEYCGQMH